jgi:outer membrane lipoprotein-sorting protein
MKRIVFALLIILVLTVPAYAELTVDEIISRLDANQYMGSAYMMSKFIIRGGRREVVKEMEAWVSGKDKALLVFLNPGDKGTKYLKLGDELWMFFPDAEDLVKLSGHMLKQGMMGSDFSYEDALESEKMGELYTFQLVGKDTYNGRDSYVLEARVIPGKKVSYPLRKIWIDKERFVALKEELYAASGKLMKVSQVQEVEKKDGRFYAKEVIMEDRLKKGSSTKLIIERIDFDVEISDELFSLRSLMR